MHERTRSLIVIVDSHQQLPVDWRLRNENDHVLLRPYSQMQLAALIERHAINLHKRNAIDCNTAEHLSFLTTLINSEQNTGTSVEPSFSCERHSGVFYPSVQRSYGLNIESKDLLEYLTGLGLLSRRIINRLHTCPKCASAHLHYRELCPHCESVNFSEEMVLHHFPCGHIASLDDFLNNDDKHTLTCPKCHKELRHIGLDYEKPTSNIACHACSFIFTEPLIIAECHHCNTSTAPNATPEVLVHSYQTTDQAHSAVDSGVIQNVDLDRILHNSSGVYPRDLFLWVTKRELARFKRHRIASSTIIVRINDIESLRESLGGNFSTYVTMLYGLINEHLRDLDLTCIWERVMLAILLPSTPIEGAHALARRLEERAKLLSTPLDVPENKIICSAQTLDDDTASYHDIVAAAIRVHDLAIEAPTGISRSATTNDSTDSNS